MTDLTTLIAKLEAATGQDRALAREIQCSIGGWHRITPSQCNRKRGGYISPIDWIGRRPDGVPILDQMHGTDIHDDVPDITSSIDAAVALAERVLPGFVFDNLGQDYMSADNGYKAIGWTVEVINGSRFQGQAQSLPIAIVIAILRAKQAEGKA